jgi:hypothetical protein
LISGGEASRAQSSECFIDRGVKRRASAVDPKHVKQRYLMLVLPIVLTAWAAVTHSWAAPGFATLAIGQASLTVFWRRAHDGRAAPGAVVPFLALSYVGLAYLLALLAGTPEHARFWVVVILAPVVVLARGLR